MRTIPDNFSQWSSMELARGSIPMIHCDRCGEEIQCETEEYEADACYDIAGEIICEDCILEYAAEMFAVKLIVENGRQYIKKL